MVCTIKTAAALVGAWAGAATAHFHVTGIVADGVYYGGYSLDYYYEKVNTGAFTESVGWYAENLDNGFIAPDAYNTSDLVCHLNGQPANLTATVAAGGSVEFQWTTVGHPGPVLTYVALCPGECTSPTLDKAALEWLKIDEAGYNAADQAWASDTLAASNNSWTVAVPATLAAGNYVFRHEIIALHGAQALNGAQNYPQCVNIAITGGSGSGGGAAANPAGTLGEALYAPTDAGINFNPYATITDYPIPGPALIDGSVEQPVAGTNGAGNGTSAPSAAASAPDSLGGSSSGASGAEGASTEDDPDACDRRRHARDMIV